ncbi:MAG: hypothetical protein A3B34_01365 [Candidatus Sungbacteria bacterium RIFCSPLOWO2_01_FULL_54_21]|uniref:Uncharacterized protein n=2 Tax=Candidatus Sungiibacteriota TaxID=1817917 RepID=A0A1G2L4C1_9BACT|nr:MAG: hypothetical protein A2679_02170 [Candidatus Sungbacteria bacterium RIFCSPHIGHO2_01_FULL_54_26]OHA02694.1 MAG: hypothetical protein A3C92_02630 [Candidatus Sungbacteria bacterium RIFCSPHIGHO2_02_FULL_53_17]OHA06546.1 MAG: hypothetical protein A3B34_01365 [Candidatus Sungbacteria bacterium RIFCSPLOWO2_01_FULL_54_21]
MTFLIVGFLFVIGLVIGSFLNVVILRGERGEGLGGRSRCMACGRILGISELVPVASFIFQHGRCRGCRERFSVQYPLVELGTALAFAGIAWFFVPVLMGGGTAISAQALLNLGVLLLAACAAIVIFVADFRFQIIPVGAVIVLGLAGIVVTLGRNTLLGDLAAVIGCSLFFFLLSYVSGGRWMGNGDWMLVFATSLVIGFPSSIAAFLFSFWLGSIVGLTLLALGKKSLQSRIPFGPFILAGALLAWRYADAFFAYTGLSLLL